MRRVISAQFSSTAHYPDPHCMELLAAAARHDQVERDEIIAGNGPSELLYAIPRVLTCRRAVIAIPCYSDSRRAAALPARVIGKSLVSDRMVIDTVVANYSDHLPLYRQSAILERETGLEISRATLDGWLMRVVESLAPMAGVMRREFLSGSYIQADETPVDVQLHDGRGKNRQAYLWRYSRPGGGAVFDFQLGRGREGPKRFLGPFAGILQTDGDVAYERVGGRKWCMPAVGRVRAAALWRRLNSTRTMGRPRVSSWRSMSCSGSTPAPAGRT